MSAPRNVPPGVRERLEAERARREEMAALLRPSASERFRRALDDVWDGLTVLALIAVICVGAAGVLGTCIGVVIALVRAGWRAGASL